MFGCFFTQNICRNLPIMTNPDMVRAIRRTDFPPALPCPCPADTSSGCTRLLWTGGSLWPRLPLLRWVVHRHPTLWLPATNNRKSLIIHDIQSVGTGNSSGGFWKATVAFIFRTIVANLKSKYVITSGRGLHYYPTTLEDLKCPPQLLCSFSAIEELGWWYDSLQD